MKMGAESGVNLLIGIVLASKRQLGTCLTGI
jgi:hypothetical protein